MPYDTHVFLGPSLPLDVAKRLLPNAHYHHPIACGDLCRTMRLNPKRIVIIDGYFEHTPAVWHKEILYALESGIEVWGAASMGALRASELHQYGMQGIGEIFEKFKSGEYNDDDEVAVVHLPEYDDFMPINDAMVNIRATLVLSLKENIISQSTHDKLLSDCKALFYPYRLLKKIIQQQLHQEPQEIEYQRLLHWIEINGVYDIKQQDAISLLKHLANLPIQNDFTQTFPYTGYFKTLLNYVDATPFKKNYDWLPDLEKKYIQIKNDNPQFYKIIAELAVFTKKMYWIVDDKINHIDNELVLNYIHQKGLYSPEEDFKYLLFHPEISETYQLICQLICETKLTHQIIENYLPIIAHYYELELDKLNHKEILVLKRLLIIILLLKNTLHDQKFLLKQDTIQSHFDNICKKRQYTAEQAKLWLEAKNIDEYQFMSFVMLYIMSYAVITLFDKLPQKKNKFNWSGCVLELL